MTSPDWQPLIDQALAEDLGEAGDLTSQYFVEAKAQSRVQMVAREPCTLSGIEIASQVFLTVDPSLEIRSQCRSGSTVAPSEINTRPLLEIVGRSRSILTAERTALNFAQRLSGVATLTARYVEAVSGTGTTILDTRKTTPGWRHLEKAAVRHGGGRNHRLGLYDRVMIKDNHLASGSALATLQVRIDALRADHPEVEVEIEADTLEQVEGFLTLRGVDYLLLDNMGLGELRQAVEMAKNRGIPLEASGGITLENAQAVAETGVQYLSVGALTHSSRSIDLALDAKDRRG